MAHQTVQTSDDRRGRRSSLALLGGCTLALATVIGTGFTAWAGTSSGTVAAGCQAYAGDPSGPPIGPIANQPTVTATFTHPDSATAGSPFDVSVDLSGWMNSVVTVDGSGTKLVVTLGLTGATESSVEAIVGPPGPGASANTEFSVPTATVSVTPAGNGPVTVTLDSWAVDNPPVNVYVECTLQSGSATAEIPVESGGTETTAPANGAATTIVASSGGATTTVASPTVASSAGASTSNTLAAGGFDSNTVILAGVALSGIGLIVLGPGLRRRRRNRAVEGA